MHAEGVLAKGGAHLDSDTKSRKGLDRVTDRTSDQEIHVRGPDPGVQRIRIERCMPANEQVHVHGSDDDSSRPVLGSSRHQWVSGWKGMFQTRACVVMFARFASRVMPRRSQH